MVKTSWLAGARAYTAEHVLVAERSLGRKILSTEVVHHINGVQSDNRPENLHVCTRSAHSVMHSELERLAMEMVREGLIEFDGQTYVRRK